MVDRFLAPYVINTVANLRTLPGDKLNVCRLAGYTSSNDGAHGDLYWDPTSIETDNGGTIFQVSGVATGRWKRQFSGPLNVLWFGAKGDFVTDDAAAINATIQAALDSNSGRVFFPKPSGRAYKILSSIDIAGSGDKSVWLEGEISGIADSNGTRIEFLTPGSNAAVIDIKGSQGVRISNLDIRPAGNAKYGVWIRPNGSAVAENIELHWVNIQAPRDVAGAAALAIGDVGGIQASEITVRNCKLFGNDGYSAYNAVGFKNLVGGNVKNISFYDCGFVGFKYALDLTFSSGPVSMYGVNTASSLHVGMFLMNTGRLDVHGLDVETCDDGCNLLTGSQGAGNNDVSFQGCEISLKPSNHEMVHWIGGTVRFINSQIQNDRAIVISSVTNTNPPVATVVAGHELLTGDYIQIQGATGMTGINTGLGQAWQITVSGNNITLTGATNNSAYTGSGIIYCEPKIVIGRLIDTPKRGVVSEGCVWNYSVGSLPVYEATTLVRLTSPSVAQSNQSAVRSFGDVGQQPVVGTIPVALPTMFCSNLQLTAYGSGIVQSDRSGNVSAGTSITCRTVTTNYTIDSSGADLILLIDTSSARSITLPTPTNGRIIIFKDSTGSAATNNITLVRHASEKIEGSTTNTYGIATNFGSFTLTSNGTDWFVEGR